LNEQLNYDQFDLDIFSNNYIVGRGFSSEEEANAYLKSVIDKSRGKSINDFVVVKDIDDYTLKPYRIYPKPNDMEVRRNQASKFISKYGILSSPDLRYITHPLYAYVEYRHIDKIKELGVSYKFQPIKEINLNPVLSRFLKQKGHTNSIINYKLILYNIRDLNVEDENALKLSDVKAVKKEIENLLNEFNNYLGTDYYIVKTLAQETSDSLRMSVLSKLDDKNTLPQFEKKYKQVSFVLERGNDEEEYLAVIPMESRDKPKMMIN